jgi:type II secretory pathway pseudopilin PulG
MSILRGLGRTDAGAAIVESLVATTLLGVALVFLMGSYSTFAVSSRTAEQTAIGAAFARAQVARIQAAPYRDDADYSAYYDALPTGVTRSVTKTWWDGTSAWVGSQNANGLEKLTLTATWNGGTVASIEFVKANR